MKYAKFSVFLMSAMVLVSCSDRNKGAQVVEGQRMREANDAVVSDTQQESTATTTTTTTAAAESTDSAAMENADSVKMNASSTREELGTNTGTGATRKTRMVPDRTLESEHRNKQVKCTEADRTAKKC